MAIDFTALIQDVSKKTTIEESFLEFLSEVIDELDDIYLISNNHEVRDLVKQLSDNRKSLATAMASNIV